MLKKNDLLKTGDGIIRVLDVQAEKVLVIDCIKQAMPMWECMEVFQDAELTAESDLLAMACMEEENMASYDEVLAHKRFTMIAPILPVIGDRVDRNARIRMAAEGNGYSKQTVRGYLCRFLAFQDIRVLAPVKSKEKAELTPDQKNMRWAWNKYYYSRFKNPLTTAYIKMLQEKYTDDEGNLLQEYPSIRQFRYFYKKYNKLETYYISRDGIKDYQRNHRPLLGDGIQEFAPAAGWAMHDGTVCEIYLVDDAGKVAGRPLLVASTDAFSGLCMVVARVLERKMQKIVNVFYEGL